MFLWRLFAFILYTLFNGPCCAYHIITELVDVSSAKGACADLGMQQVIIRDMTTYYDVTNYLKSVYTHTSNGVWVGMYWDIKSNVFRWSDNDAKVVESIYWDYYEPNCMTPKTYYCTHPACMTIEGCMPLNQNCVKLMLYGKFKTTTCDPGEKLFPLCQNKTVSPYGDTNTNKQGTCEPCPTSDVTTNQQGSCEPCPTSDVTTNQYDTCKPCPPCEITTIQQGTCEPCPTSDFTTNQHNQHGTCEPCPTCTFTAKQTADPTRFKVTANTNLNISTVAVKSFNKTVFQDSLFRIKKEATGSYRRRRISADDDRFSSKVIGLTGVTIVVIVCCIFPAVDMISLAKKITKK